ncbi:MULTISPECIES: hypothetical protein [unclassified Mycobacterium]|uniref:hypothetical protein n=1 Tax=unclassified Mycobacterium TaxID=2642494 RepID=UPI000491D476|nr:MULTISPECIES: hypothetical protein [unclassified Mycobacterium]SEA87404.1 hypothetical protein SAMN04488580_10535 [Mycobacterium sp. 283mftsu]
MLGICDRLPDVDPKGIQDMKERQAVHMDWLNGPEKKQELFKRAFADAYQRGKRPNDPRCSMKASFRFILDMCDPMAQLAR